ncbi:hypothetical protein EDB85DRAFT_1965631 [Lactarius pseudohatsudake]|nr:hypothetical protein EDB85DRAFT_1965631 [Lactarius pseudohatsudake]
MRAAREWGGGGARSNLERRPLLPGLARGGNAQTGTRTSGAPPLEPLPAGSCARARIGDPAEAPPLPPLREPGSPPRMHSRGARAGGARPGGVRIGRRAPVPRPPLHTGATRIHAPPLCAKRKRGLPAGDKSPRLHSRGNGGAAREGCARTRSGAPSHSCTGATRERTGSDWEGVCAKGAHARAGSGVRTPFAPTFARNRGPGRADTNGGYTEWSAHE